MAIHQFNNSTELPTLSGMQGFTHVYAATDDTEGCSLADIDMDAWMLILPMKEAKKVFDQSVKTAKKMVKTYIDGKGSNPSFAGVGVALFELQNNKAFLLSVDADMSFDSLFPEKYMNKQTAVCHFSPSSLSDEYPLVYDKVKHLFDPKWVS